MTGSTKASGHHFWDSHVSTVSSSSYHSVFLSTFKLEMCSVSTNDGEQASPAQQGSQVIGCLLTILDKHANILVESLPEYQELVHISGHECIPK